MRGEEGAERDSIAGPAPPAGTTGLGETASGAGMAPGAAGPGDTATGAGDVPTPARGAEPPTSREVNGAPQCLQKFIVEGFSTPQRGQATLPGETPPPPWTSRSSFRPQSRQ